jgi:hypothetical protein
MPQCRYVAKTKRTRYHHCKFYSTGVNFDEVAVGLIVKGGGFGSLFGSFESFEYVGIMPIHQMDTKHTFS